MSRKPVPFWVIALALLFVFLCSYMIVPGKAGLWENTSGASSFEGECSLEGFPGEAGLPSGTDLIEEAPEESTQYEDPGEAGLPSDAAGSTQEAPEESTQDEDPGEAGLPYSPALLNFSDYVSLQSEDPGEAGLPSDASGSSQEAPEESTQDEDPGEAGLSSDASGSSQEAPEDSSVDEDPGEAGEPESSVATDADLQALTQSVENVHADLWLLLFTIWGFAGIFLGYKVGGVVLGRL